MKHEITDREALCYLAGQFEAVCMGPRFSDHQLVCALLLYRGFADSCPARDDVLAEALLRNEASDVPERRGLARRLTAIMRNPPSFTEDEQ
jgi:hypothetical protein